MIASVITGNPDPEDLKKFYRALKRAQRDIDLRPDRYTHYYRNEFPDRYHAIMDTRRWGPGERIVFEPYTEEAFTESQEWIAQREIFEGANGTGTICYARCDRAPDLPDRSPRSGDGRAPRCCRPERP